MYSINYYLFRSLLKFNKATFEWNASIDKLRAVSEKSARFFKPPVDTRVDKATIGGISAELIDMPSSKPDCLLLYLHGGGYVMGSYVTHRAVTARIAEACGARAVLLEYRLAPENPFPAALEDSLAAYRGLLKQGTDPRNIIIAGDSAGGGLTLATLVSLRDQGDPLPAAAICFSPWTDLAMTGESMTTRAKADPWLVAEAPDIQARHYCGDGDRKNPLISPLYADLRGLPPILIHVGQDEILLDDSTRLAERARMAGVAVTLDIWPGMWHFWHAFAPKMPEATKAIAAAGVFARERFNTE